MPIKPNTKAYKKGVVIVMIPSIKQILNIIDTVITFLILDEYEPFIMYILLKESNRAVKPKSNRTTITLIDKMVKTIIACIIAFLISIFCIFTLNITSKYFFIYNNSYLLSFKSKKRDLTGLECGSSHPFYKYLPGNVLLSRNVSPTTIGAKVLNFCVRHGNR